MKLKEYWGKLLPHEKRSLAEECKTTISYMSQVAHGHSAPSAKFARVIEITTKGRVKRVDMLPKIFG